MAAMNPAQPSTSQQPEDIGPLQAIVGLRGWQCLLCSTVFPRVISIEHHMITSHPQQNSAPPPVASTVPVASQQHQHTSPAVQSRAAGDNMQNNRVERLSSSEAMEGVSPGVGSESTATACGTQEGSVSVKLEPVDMGSTGSVGQNACLTRDADSLAGFSLLSQPVGSTNNPNNTRDNDIVNSQNVQDMNAVAYHQPCSFSHGSHHNTGGCSHVGKHGTHCKAFDPPKHCKPHHICCGEWFYSKKDFRQHGREVHQRYKHRTFVCHICCGEFQHKRGLNRHLKEKGQLAFACNSCPKQFHDPTSLTQHQQVCDGSGEHKPAPESDTGAEGTGQAYSSSIGHTTHHHHAAADSFPWECSKCKKHFENKNHFRKHLRDCGIFEWRLGKRHFTCNLCGSGFPSLVGYHRHYVHAHKLPWLGGEEGVITNSPNHSSPFLGNSPVPSPSPSVTSEINSAMADVNLNQLRGGDVRDCPSPASSTVEHASGLEEDDDDEGDEEGKDDTKSSFYNSLVSTPQAGISTCTQAAVTISTVASAPVVPVTRTLDSLSLGSGADCSITASEPLSLNTSGPQSFGSTSNPQSLTSTSGSSDRPSLMSDFSSLGPGFSHSSAASSGQTSEVENIVISDEEEEEETHSSESSSDSEWEILMDQRGEEKEGKGFDPSSSTESKKSAQKEESSTWGDYFHPPPPPPPPPHPGHYPFHPPPPPHPHFFAEHFGGHPFFPFRPPFPHPRFPCRGGFRGGFMRGGGHPFFGAARFGPPGCFDQESNSSSEYQSKNAGASSSATDGASASSSTNTAGQNQCDGANSSTNTTQAESQSSAFNHAADFSKWAGKWKKCSAFYKLMRIKFQWLMKSRHVEEQFWLCPQYDCPQTFKEEAALEKHCRESHPDTTEFTCFICHQTLPQPAAYNRHLREHANTWGQFRGRGHHGCGGRGGMMGGGWGGWGRKWFKHMMKASSPYINPHMFWGHHSPGQGQQEPEKEPPASDCSSSNNITSSSSSNEFKECPVCKKKYRADSRENFFERHVNSHHEVEVNKFECEQCSKKFQDKGKYSAHMAKHKEAPHVCQECGKSYQSKTSLTRHQRTHTGERPHKCPDCNEGFIELRELERHRMKHTGQDPFSCTVCGSGFTLKDSLLNHVRKKHPQHTPELCCKRAMPLAEALSLKDKAQSQAQASQSQALPVTVSQVKVEVTDQQDMDMD